MKNQLKLIAGNPSARNLKIMTKTCALLVFISALPSQADPFTNSPTPRAAGMAGAYTAFANDAAAVWYNPAGLVGSFDESNLNDSPVTFDVTSNSTSQLDSQGDLSQSSDAIFVGGKFRNDDYAFGLYYYQPHRIDYALPPGDDVDLWGNVKQSIHILSIPFALSYLDGRVKVGSSLELVSIYANETQINTMDEFEWPQAQTLLEDEASSYSGSLSTQITLLDNSLREMKLMFGANYRFQAHADAKINTGNNSIDPFIMEKPSGYDLGLSWHKTLFGNQQLTLALQIGETEWNETNSYQRVSLGGEFRLPPKTMRAWQLPYQTAIQFGYYTSEVTLQNESLAWPDSSGASIGVSIDTGRQFSLAFAAEQRTITSAENVKNTANFFTLGLTWKMTRK